MDESSEARKRFDLLARFMFGENKERASQIFDKFNAIDYGPQILYWFTRRFDLESTPEQISTGLEKLEEIFEEYGNDSKKHFFIGMSLHQFLR